MNYSQIIKIPDGKTTRECAIKIVNKDIDENELKRILKRSLFTQLAMGTSIIEHNQENRIGGK